MTCNWNALHDLFYSAVKDGSDHFQVAPNWLLFCWTKCRRLWRDPEHSPTAGMAICGTCFMQASCFRYMRVKGLSTPQAASPSITAGIIVSIAAPMNPSPPSPLQRAQQPVSASTATNLQSFFLINPAYHAHDPPSSHL